MTPAAEKLFQKLAVLQAVSYKLSNRPTPAKGIFSSFGPTHSLPQQPKHDAPRGAVLQLCAEAILIPGSQSVPLPLPPGRSISQNPPGFPVWWTCPLGGCLPLTSVRGEVSMCMCVRFEMIIVTTVSSMHPEGILILNYCYLYEPWHPLVPQTPSPSSYDNQTSCSGSEEQDKLFSFCNTTCF